MARLMESFYWVETSMCFFPRYFPALLHGTQHTQEAGCNYVQLQHGSSTWLP